MRSRRAAIASTLFSSAGYLLLREVRALAADLPARLGAKRWIARQDELARGLASGAVSQREWHNAVGTLATELDVAQLVAEIGRSKLRQAGAPFGHDPVKRFVAFVDGDGKPLRLSYGAALFSFGRDSVITPHAHKHMASAHMVVDGKVRIRTFDRVSDEEGWIVVRPTADKIATAGEAAAMTSATDNVHWFAPRSEKAMTFDVIIDSLDPGEPSYVIQPLDILAGQQRHDGTIRAQILTFEESSRRYTAAL